MTSVGMRSSIIFLLLFNCTNGVAQDATASLFSECLKYKTDLIKKQVAAACWKQAENANGVVDDTSPSYQAALFCEQQKTRNIQVSEEAVLACRKDSQMDEPRQLISQTAKFTSPDLAGVPNNPIQPGRPPPIPPVPPGTAPAAEVDRGQVAADVASCGQLESLAVSCCRNPASCTSEMNSGDQQSLARLRQMQEQGPQAGQGMAEYCKQMEQLQASTGNVYSGIGSVCASRQSSCQTSCQAQVQKYQGLLKSCANCASASLYRDTITTLTNKANQCDQLKVQANQMSAQGIQSGSGQGYANACQSLAASQPMNSGLGALPFGGMPTTSDKQNKESLEEKSVGLNDSSDCQANPNSPECGGCEKNPTSAACRILASTAEQNAGSGGFGDVKPGQKNSDFNLPDISGASPSHQFGYYEPKSDNKIAAIPNHNGGPIPGSGAAQGSARLDSNGAPKTASAMAQLGSPTDIMTGFRSGGGYTPPVYASGLEGSQYNPRTKSYYKRNLGVQAAGIDLKKYLPNGSHAPYRHMAGLNGVRTEINGRNEDLFRKISEKITEKCRLGILWECRP